jgi:hypothetical protein
MSDDNLEIMPNWKRDATMEERFHEFAMVARKYPNRFKNVVIIYEEDFEDTSKTRYMNSDMTTKELLGLIEQARMEVFIHCKGWNL